MKPGDLHVHFKPDFELNILLMFLQKWEQTKRSLEKAASLLYIFFFPKIDLLIKVFWQNRSISYYFLPQVSPSMLYTLRDCRKRVETGMFYSQALILCGMLSLSATNASQLHFSEAWNFLKEGPEDHTACQVTSVMSESLWWHGL